VAEVVARAEVRTVLSLGRARRVGQAKGVAEAEAVALAGQVVVVGGVAGPLLGSRSCALRSPYKM